MVSGVQTSIGSSAYLKGSQLAGNKGDTGDFKRQVAGDGAEGGNVKNAEKTLRTTDSRESTASPKVTQLETRNDTETLRTEQARGSLLDIAV